MDPLWLLKGGYEAPGWKDLERDARAEDADVLLFDRLAWALMRAPEPPTNYEGLTPVEPPDGLYLNDQGNPLYLVNGKVVPGPEDVIDALGKEAQEMLDEIGDPDTVLERLGRTF